MASRLILVGIAVALIVFAIGLITQQRFFGGQFVLPSGGETRTETVKVETEAGVSEREIMVTDEVKHSIPLSEIRSGGPPKDGIPSIDRPKFIPVEEARAFLDDDEAGLALSLRGVDRFYPFQILVHHELVNDTIADQRVLVSYCPLCLTAIVFDPLVGDERVEFGVSGKLWNSNLLMYDRKTDSLWAQVLGEAVVGEMTGTTLPILVSDLMRFGKWSSLHPDGKVLSRETGALRRYGVDPYGDYYTTPGTYFPVSAKDDRLGDKDVVLGIVVDGQAKAYATEAVKLVGEVEEEFAGKTIVARYEEDADVVRIYEKEDAGTLKRLNPVVAFWFSWFASHPDTELYK